MSRILASTKLFSRFSPTVTKGFDSISQSSRTALQYARTRTRPGPLILVPSACIALRTGLRHYANGPRGPPGGGAGGGGFPGFSLGPQHQKGDALKEYVRSRTHLLRPFW